MLSSLGRAQLDGCSALLASVTLVALSSGLDWGWFKMALLTYLVIVWLDPSFLEVSHPQEASLEVSLYGGSRVPGGPDKNLQSHLKP